MNRPMVVRLRHVLGWLAVVVVTAVVTTVIVTSVRRDVTDPVAGGSVALPPGLVGASTPTPRGTADVPPSAGPGSTAPPAGTSTATGGDAAAGGAENGDASGEAGEPGGSRGGATRDAEGGADARSGSTAAGAAPSDGTATRTFSTPGGAAVVGCRGGQPYARAVTPRYGWSFETETEPGELDVTFKQPGQEYPLHVMCRGSQPVLTEGYGSGHR